MQMLTLADISYRVELLAEDSFTSLANWQPETNGILNVNDGMMHWHCDGSTVMGTLWYTTRFTGPTVVEYEGRCLAGEANLNFHLYGDAPAPGLLATSATRTGLYDQYHTLSNYIITYVREDAVQRRIRFRKTPGFNLLTETYITRPVDPLRWEHLTYVADGDGGLAFYLDGKHVAQITDTASPLRSGYHGFRTWNSVLQYRNFRVYRLLA